jgi:GTP-binding protein HflX
LEGVRHVEEFTLSFAQGKQRAWLFRQDVVISEEQGEEGFALTVRWTDKQKAQFNAL